MCIYISRPSWASLPLQPYPTPLGHQRARGRALSYRASPTSHLFCAWLVNIWGFPDSSVGKESAGNAGDPSLIPGPGRSPGEGKACPLQRSWASLVAQLIKNPPATWETWDRSLGWEDPLEEGKATHSSILAWRIPWTVHGVAKSRHNWATFTFSQYIRASLIALSEREMATHSSVLA